MATTTGMKSYPLLDQLQQELNRVLEQTGRVLAASNQEGKPIPIAQATRLKQILPGSVDRSHHALDQLEDELQTAQRVMRRELALIREREGVAQPVATQASVPATTPVTAPRTDTVVEQPREPETLPSPQAAEDVSMLDAKPDVTTVPDESKAPDAPESVEEAPIKAPENEDVTVTAAPEPAAKSDPPPVQSEAEQKPLDVPLQIDTQPQPKTDAAENGLPMDDDKQPDTGTFSNANDFESLFGAPTSADAADAPDFNLDNENDNGDFDFGSFGNDGDGNTNDNENSLSALLPGLQDYANTQPGVTADTDFSALFSADLPGTNDGQANNEGGSNDLGDFMDFGDFGDGSFTAGNAGGSGNNNIDNEDFDFAFD